MRAVGLPCLVFLAALASGCSSRTTTVGSGCVPGEQRECDCDDGSTAQQLCGADGESFDACQCGVTPGVAGSSGAGGARTDGGATARGGAGGQAGSGGTIAASGAGGSAGSTTAPFDSARPQLTCDYYCSAVEAHCRAGNQQYSDRATCLGVCGLHDEGTLGDTSGNSVACRIAHANFAEAGPNTHCRHAGPSGVGTCGSSCSGYCTLMLSRCPQEFADEEACLNACEGLSGTEPGALYAIGVPGDSVLCRIFHATLATGDAADEECGYAGIESQGFCL